MLDPKIMHLVAPEFGQAMPQCASPDTVELLFNRRSCSAMTLGLPAPNDDQMDLLIKLGLRVPDHGKLGPWRIVRFTPQSKARLVKSLEGLVDDQPDPKTAKAALLKLSTPPEALLVISSPVQPHAIPLWEQQQSAAAVCQNLLIGAGALGFGANWITDWYAYDPMALTLLGVKSHERVAGFIYIGTPNAPPLERERPNHAERVSFWMG